MTLNISVNDFVNWMPRVLGGALSAPNIPLAEAIPYFGMMMRQDGGASICFNFKEVKVIRCRIEGRGMSFGQNAEPAMMVMTLEFMGIDVTYPATWPTPPVLGSADQLDQPLQLADTDGAITVGGSAREIDFFRLDI